MFEKEKIFAHNIATVFRLNRKRRCIALCSVRCTIASDWLWLHRNKKKKKFSIWEFAIEVWKHAMFILKVLLIRTFGGCEMPHHISHTCKRSSVHHIFHHSLGIHTPAVFHASSRDRRQFTNQCLFGYKELRNEQQRRWFSFRTFISTHAKPGNSRRSLSSCILHLYLSMFSRLWDHTCIHAFVSLRTLLRWATINKGPTFFVFLFLVSSFWIDLQISSTGATRVE